MPDSDPFEGEAPVIPSREQSAVASESIVLPMPETHRMRTLNYIFAVTSIVLGVLLILFMLTQTVSFNIGTAIGIVLVLNGLVRIWFAQGDDEG